MTLLKDNKHAVRPGATFATVITRTLGSNRFLYALMICFVIQALWLAFTARYPMAFDENFHFGLIQLHASQWLPFFTHQPPGADIFGAVTRDPSYLFHFLFSLPYRLIRIITDNTTAQVISLRVMNIALFVYGFFLLHQLLRRLGASKPLANLILFLFSFMPIVPFLASQINYDNMLVPLTAGVFLIMYAWVDELRRGRISVARTATLLSLLLLGCLVKYAFLPVLGASVLFMVWQLWRERRRWPELWQYARMPMRARATVWAVAAGLLLVISIGLFSQQYVVNLWEYHTPIPDCAQVMSHQACMQYGPWQRNYTYAQQLPASFRPNAPDYVWQWMYGMWQRSFFAISDTYVTMPPLPLIGGAAIVLATAGTPLFIVYGRRILAGNIYRQYGFGILVVYMLSLFVYTYRSYVYTGVPVAINGRYLVPFLPLMFLFAGFAFAHVLRSRQKIKAVAVTLTVLCFLQGGGALTFIVQSDDSWNWPNSSVVHANNAARKVLHPLIAGSRKQ